MESHSIWVDPKFIESAPYDTQSKRSKADSMDEVEFGQLVRQWKKRWL